MNAVLSSFVGKIQIKHWKNLQRKTQKLERSEQEDLLEFLEDHLAGKPSAARDSLRSGSDDANGSFTEDNESDDDNDDDEFVEDDYRLCQRDLDKANGRLEELQSKHDFLLARLQNYRSKIARAEDSLLRNNDGASQSPPGTPSSSQAEEEESEKEESAPAPPITRPSLTPEKRARLREILDGYKQALQPIEDTYRSIEEELLAHQKLIESMQERQLDLQLKTQECRVVLEELSHSVGASPNPNNGEPTATVVEGASSTVRDDLLLEEDGDLEMPETTQRTENADETSPEALNEAAVDENSVISRSIPVGTHAE